MLHDIPHSPVAQTTYLKDALRQLRYEDTIDGFCTFFLHNLALEHAVLGQIVEDNSDKCLLAMSWLTSLEKIKDKLLADKAMVVDEEPTKQFPISNEPSWEQIIDNGQQPKAADVQMGMG
jgi:hypothetical protein